MVSIKLMAKEAKQRMKNDYWNEQKKKLTRLCLQAEREGKSVHGTQSAVVSQIKKEVKGEVDDEFYLRVKDLLDREGEVSDALGRLTDQTYFATLSYEEKQRYTLNLSNRYVQALEKYKKEKLARL